MRQGEIWANNVLAGILTEDEEGYHFMYTSEYLMTGNAVPVSLTLPLQARNFKNKISQLETSAAVLPASPSCQQQQYADPPCFILA